MERTARLDGRPAVADWRVGAHYDALLGCDRRAFAWEWLRRSPAYRDAAARASSDPMMFGLVAFVDPGLPVEAARPIWAPHVDRQVLDSYVQGFAADRADQLDIRMLAEFVSVEVKDGHTEHWLFSNGKWCVRIDLHDGTLLGGPLLLDHRIRGLASAEPKLFALRQLIALCRDGALPIALHRRETRAPRWILELRTADGLAAGASHQQLARTFFGQTVAAARWRLESASYRSRVQRLARAARKHLKAPLIGPWFG